MHNLSQGRLAAHFGRFEAQRTGPVDRATNDLISGLLADGQAFPRHHTFVDGTFPLGHDAIDRHLLTRAQQEEVAHLDLLDRHRANLPIGADEVGLRGCQAQEGIEGIRGPPATAHLHPVPKEHKGDEHGRRVVACIHPGCKQGGEDAEEIGDEDSQAHQHVHIQRAIAQGAPGPEMKYPAAPPHDGRGEHEQDPVGTHTKGRRQVQMKEGRSQGRVEDDRDGE